MRKLCLAPLLLFLVIFMLGALACTESNPERSEGESTNQSQAITAPEQAEEKSSEDSKHPWADARVGDWAKYKVGENTTTTWVVTAVSETEVTYDSVMVAFGITMSPQTETISLVPEQEVENADHESESKDSSEEPSILKLENEREPVEIAGTTYVCRVFTLDLWAVDGSGTSKTYLSSDMHLGGLIKMTYNAEVIKELVEWGRGK